MYVCTCTNDMIADHMTESTWLVSQFNDAYPNTITSTRTYMCGMTNCFLRSDFSQISFK